MIHFTPTSQENQNAELEPQVVAEVKKPVNMSEAFAQTTAELKQLDWSTQEGRNYLKQKYGKTSRQQLTDDGVFSTTPRKGIFQIS